MKLTWVAAIAAISLTRGVGIGFAARPEGAGVTVITGKSDQEAARAALAEAERLTSKGYQELIAIGRVYYLSGDKAKGDALFARVIGVKKTSTVYQLIADMYAEAGENAKAEENYSKMLGLESESGSQEADVGAWYIRTGQRARGEEHLGRAFRLDPHEPAHYIHAAQSLLGIPAGSLDR